MLAAGVCEQVHHLLLIGRVDAGGRLVGQDHFRTVGQGPGYGHPLLLTHRELSRLVMEAVAQADRLEELSPPGPVGPAGGERHRHEHVLERREPRQEVELLEHEAQRVGPEPIAAPLGEPRDVGAGHDHRARIGPHDP